MIYRALIVDDEPIMRHGLSSCVDWQAAGIEPAGEAGNGEAALELVREREIDILITDIKMPLMDGMELIRRAKEIRPHLKAIVVSSYGDFDLVRQAVRLDAVVDYLLKPTMEPEDLVRLLDECRRRLDAEKSLRTQSSLYEAEREKTSRRLAEAEMKKALSGQPAALNGIAAALEAPYVLAVWRFEGAAAESSAEPGIKHASLIGSIAERAEREFADGLLCFTREDEWALLLSDRHGAAVGGIRRFHERLSAEDGRPTVGVTPPFHAPDRLLDAYGWAENAFIEAFHEGAGRCYAGSYNSAGIADPVHEAADWAALREPFSRCLADSDRQGCEEALGRLFGLWSSRRYRPETIRKQAEELLILMDSGRYYLKTGEKLEKLLQDRRKVEDIGGLRELKELVSDRLGKSLEAGRPPAPASDDPGGSRTVQAALGYIQERYRGNLPLQDVAAHVHMSKNYFSEQFKRQTGMNFIDYVIRLRIQYARHLLETTTLKIHDIGEHCGFNSAKHFLKLFKRESGQTPMEYRNRMQSEAGRS